jgi:hypothetical protein
MASVGVNHRDFQAIHKANGIHPDFAIVVTVINPFNGWPLENPHSILKGNAMPLQVDPVLFVSPTIPTVCLSEHPSCAM